MSVIDRLADRYRAQGSKRLVARALELRRRAGHIQDREAVALERRVNGPATDPVDCLDVYLCLFGVQEVIDALEAIRRERSFDVAYDYTYDFTYDDL